MDILELSLLIVIVALLLDIWAFRFRAVRFNFRPPSKTASDYTNPLPASSTKTESTEIRREGRTEGPAGHGIVASTDRIPPDVVTESSRREAESPPSPLLRLTTDGIAWIANTNVKVIEVAVDKLAHGSSPEEMHFQYPHLSLAQIHAALAYYYDHQDELDAEIRTRQADADELAAKLSDQPLRRRLLKLKQERDG